MEQFILFQFINILGISAAIYSHIVKIKSNKYGKNYRAFCDFNSRMSCSKAFTSEYGTGFGVFKYVFGKDNVFNQPNTVYGILFYIINMLMAFSSNYFIRLLQYYSLLGAQFISVYLCFILIFILRDLCVVCFFTYFLNYLLFTMV